MSFEYIRPIATGSSSEVYLARSFEDPNVEVAVKKVAGDATDKSRHAILAEIQYLSNICHTNIVNYIGHQSSDDNNSPILLFLEYCSFGDLFSFIRCENSDYLEQFIVHNVVIRANNAYDVRPSNTSQNRHNTTNSIENARYLHFSEQWIGDITIQLIFAIHYLHSNGIVHRDIKSHNIFLLYDERSRFKFIAKIGDFGVAKICEGEILCQTQIGTPLYMPPEIYRGEVYNEAIDLWGLGVVLYELIERRYPFNAKSLNALAVKVLKQNPRISRRLKNPDLGKLCIKLLDKDPSKRPCCKSILSSSKLFTKRINTVVEYLIKYQMSCSMPNKENNNEASINVDCVRILLEQMSRLGFKHVVVSKNIAKYAENFIFEMTQTLQDQLNHKDFHDGRNEYVSPYKQSNLTNRNKTSPKHQKDKFKQHHRSSIGPPPSSAGSSVNHFHGGQQHYPVFDPQQLFLHQQQVLNYPIYHQNIPPNLQNFVPDQHQNDQNILNIQQQQQHIYNQQQQQMNLHNNQQQQQQQMNLHNNQEQQQQMNLHNNRQQQQIIQNQQHYSQIDHPITSLVEDNMIEDLNKLNNIPDHIVSPTNYRQKHHKEEITQDPPQQLQNNQFIVQGVIHSIQSPEPTSRDDDKSTARRASDVASSQYPPEYYKMTPKEQMAFRKRQKADEELERFKSQSADIIAHNLSNQSHSVKISRDYKTSDELRAGCSFGFEDKKNDDMESNIPNTLKNEELSAPSPKLDVGDKTAEILMKDFSVKKANLSRPFEPSGDQPVTRSPQPKPRNIYDLANRINQDDLISNNNVYNKNVLQHQDGVVNHVLQHPSQQPQMVNVSPMKNQVVSNNALKQQQQPISSIASNISTGASNNALLMTNCESTIQMLSAQKVHLESQMIALERAIQSHRELLSLL